ncbi:MAG: tRNA (guanine(37)-N(1))-methyltransferase, partial [Planctomycetia bacterium]
SPQGSPFRQESAEQLACDERVLLLCGRYEGFDQRLLEHFAFEELSIGDFVLAGGELPALCVVEAVARLLPDVLGDERSAAEDSFGKSGLLDHPHYTRPRVFRGLEAPPILLSGDHAKIQSWRHAQALQRTRARRADMLEPD